MYDASRARGCRQTVKPRSSARRSIYQVLAALQILGRGVCYDDVSQLSHMSEQTVGAVFHQFCSLFAKELYREYIKLPTGDAQATVMKHYDMLGFSGAIGSTDVTHVRWDCPFSLQRSYTGKEGYPTIAYQATVDFSGRVLGTTTGFPGAHNDKTIIRYDPAVMKIREDPQYAERTFSLKRADGTTEEHRGNYLIVDNGYHKVNRYYFMLEVSLLAKFLACASRTSNRRRVYTCSASL